MKTMGAVPKEQRPAGQAHQRQGPAAGAAARRPRGAHRDAEIAAQTRPPGGLTRRCRRPTVARAPCIRTHQGRRRDVAGSAQGGVTVADGPRGQTEYYCSDALTRPHHRRARAGHLYCPEGRPFGNRDEENSRGEIPSRTHTVGPDSPHAQGETHIRIRSPGAFPPRTSDATHATTSTSSSASTGKNSPCET